MNKDTILSLVRHILTTAGAVAIQKGYLDGSTSEAVIGGIVAVVGFFLFRAKKAQ